MVSQSMKHHFIAAELAVNLERMDIRHFIGAEHSDTALDKACRDNLEKFPMASWPMRWTNRANIQHLWSNSTMHDTFAGTMCLCSRKVKKSVPVDIIFQELQQMRWHDFWWRRVSRFWSALVEADTGSLHSIIFHDAIQAGPCRVQIQLGCPGLAVLFSFG